MVTQDTFFGSTFSVEKTHGGDATVMWSDAHEMQVGYAAQKVQERFNAVLHDSNIRAYFGNIEFRITDEDPLQATGRVCVAETDPLHQRILFRVGTTINAQDDLCLNQYTITHELGHLLKYRIAKGGGQDPVEYLRDNLIYGEYYDTITETTVRVNITALDASGFWTRGRYGWGCEDWSQQHRETPSMLQDERLDEAFADMFLNWVYDSFSDDFSWMSANDQAEVARYHDFDPGTRRKEYMDDMMQLLAPYAKNVR